MNEDTLGSLDATKLLIEATVDEINADFGNVKKEDAYSGKTIETYFVTTDYGIKS